MKNIIIIGADVSGMNIYDIINDINLINQTWRIIGYIDEFTVDKELFDIPIFKSFNDIIKKLLINSEDTYIISAIGSPKNRTRLMYEGKKYGFKWAKIIHPTAICSKTSFIEDGAILCQNVLIQSFAYISELSYIHTGCVIGPKVRINKGVTINSLCAISAKTTIEDFCYIGVGTKIIQNKIIGNNSIIGAGSVVIDNIPQKVLCVGMPAKVKKEL